jgi:hypothetical protein
MATYTPTHKMCTVCGKRNRTVRERACFAECGTSGMMCHNCMVAHQNTVHAMPLFAEGAK